MLKKKKQPDCKVFTEKPSKKTDFENTDQSIFRVLDRCTGNFEVSILTSSCLNYDAQPDWQQQLATRNIVSVLTRSDDITVFKNNEICLVLNDCKLFLDI